VSRHTYSAGSVQRRPFRKVVRREYVGMAVYDILSCGHNRIANPDFTHSRRRCLTCPIKSKSRGGA